MMTKITAITMMIKNINTMIHEDLGNIING